MKTAWEAEWHSTCTVFLTLVCLSFRERLVLAESTDRLNLPEKLLSENFILENLLRQRSCQQGQGVTCLSAFLNTSYAVCTSLSYQLWISGFIRLNGAPQLSLRRQHFSLVSSWAADPLPAITPANFLCLTSRPSFLTNCCWSGGLPRAKFEQTVKGNVLLCSPPT